MSIKNPKLLIFSASMLAYSIVGIASCAFGYYSTKIINKEIVSWIAVGLFLIFSI